MNKQMQEISGSRLGGGKGEVTSLFRNSDCISCYITGGFILGDSAAKTVEDGLDVLAREQKTNPNIFASLTFMDEVSVDNGEKLLSGHVYRISGYDKSRQIIKVVNPHNSNVYKDVSLEVFKAARPDFSVFKIALPKK